MSKDQALRLALEALLEYQDHLRGQAITAIKQALANDALDRMADNERELGIQMQPEPPCKTGSQCTSKCEGCAEPEPAAWMYESVCGNDFATRCEPPSYARNIRPLYTSPPKREWQGLTDDEIRPLCDENHIIFGSYTVDFIQSIEAKLKAKNGFPQTESNT